MVVTDKTETEDNAFGSNKGRAGFCAAPGPAVQLIFCFFCHFMIAPLLLSLSTSTLRSSFFTLLPLLNLYE